LSESKQGEESEGSCRQNCEGLGATSSVGALVLKVIREPGVVVVIVLRGKFVSRADCCWPAVAALTIRKVRAISGSLPEDFRADLPKFWMRAVSVSLAGGFKFVPDFLVFWDKVPVLRWVTVKVLGKLLFRAEVLLISFPKHGIGGRSCADVAPPAALASFCLADVIPHMVNAVVVLVAVAIVGALWPLLWVADLCCRPAGPLDIALAILILNQGTNRCV